MADFFGEIAKLQREMDRVFDNALAGWSAATGGLARIGSAAPMDVEDIGSHYLVSVSMPGVKANDIRIELANDSLHVRAERREDHEENNRKRFRMETFRGVVEQYFPVPSGTRPEQIETEYRDGMLKIAIPKAEAQSAQPIPIGNPGRGVLHKQLGTPMREARSQPQTTEKKAA